MLLEIKDLSVYFRQGNNDVKAVEKACVSVERGSSVGIVGESGSGKSTLALSILGLLPYPKAYHPSGSIAYNRDEILKADEAFMRSIRGNKISMIFQEPLTSLNPLHSIGKQIAEAIQIHQKMSKKEVTARVIELLYMVGLEDLRFRLSAFPHELSGGQRQRVMIAMALANNPDILIADEPTTALDVTVQAQILGLIKKLQKELGMSLILISHDLNVINNMTDTTIVMKDGVIVETGLTADIFKKPKHEYTKHLMQSNLPPKEKADFSKTNSILEASNIKVSFPVSKNFWGNVTKSFNAVDDISISLKEGQTLGIVGESGSGKTTLGLSLCKLQQSIGEIVFNKHNISNMSAKSFRPLRSQIQIVFQDPFSSLSPRLTIGEIIAEGLKAQSTKPSKEELEEMIINALKEVELSPDIINRYPHEFSGGQRQRISIARALALKPKVLILDEPTSALDVSVQAQVISLLNKLQSKHNISYIFISHDLKTVRAMADDIIVMKQGKIVERGNCSDIFNAPKDEYTKKLLKSSFALEEFSIY